MMTHRVRFGVLHKTLDGVVSARVRDELLAAALKEGRQTVIPEEPDHLRAFVEGPLRKVLERGLGVAFAAAIADELLQVLSNNVGAKANELDWNEEIPTQRRRSVPPLRRPSRPAPIRRPSSRLPRINAPAAAAGRSWQEQAATARPPQPQRQLASTQAPPRHPAPEIPLPSPSAHPPVVAKALRQPPPLELELDEPRLPFDTLEDDPPTLPHPLEARLTPEEHPVVPLGALDPLPDPPLDLQAAVEPTLPRVRSHAVVLVASTDSAFLAALAHWARGSFIVTPVRDVFGLLHELEETQGRLIVLLDMTNPSLRPVALAALASDLPLDARVMLMEPSEEQIATLRAICSAAEQWETVERPVEKLVHHCRAALIKD